MRLQTAAAVHADEDGGMQREGQELTARRRCWRRRRRQSKVGIALLRFGLLLGRLCE